MTALFFVAISLIYLVQAVRLAGEAAYGGTRLLYAFELIKHLGGWAFITIVLALFML